MADNFDLRKFLVENHLGPYSKVKEESFSGINEDEEPVKMDGFYFFDDYDSWKNKMYASFPQTESEPETYVKINGKPASKGALDNINVETDKVKCTDGYVNYGGWDPKPLNKNYRRGSVNASAGMTASDLVRGGGRLDEGSTLDKVDDALEMLRNLHSNVSTNSNLNVEEKQGMLDAFEKIASVIEDLGADVEQEEDSNDYFKRRKSEY